ncbi:hypothetical protein BH18ACI2_BH18ACI2_01430 [soil metagenome]
MAAAADNSGADRECLMVVVAGSPANARRSRKDAGRGISANDTCGEVGALAGGVVAVVFAGMMSASSFTTETRKVVAQRAQATRVLKAAGAFAISPCSWHCEQIIFMAKILS